MSRNEATIELPSGIVEQLVDYGLKTPAGQVVLTTLLNLNPALRETVKERSNNVRVTCQGGTLEAGEALAPQASTGA